MEKVAIVTGASRGIGKQIALRLGRRGFRMVIAARTEQPRPGTPGTLGETIAEMESDGTDVLGIRADMAAADDLDRIVSATLERYGRVDVLVNNAAYTVGRTLFTHVPDLARDQWDKHFAVNVTAPLMLIQACWNTMRDHGGGVVVNMTSSAARPVALTNSQDIGLPENGPAYGASKAALNRMANVIAREGAPHGIAVINVDPGFVLTETMAQTLQANGVVATDAIPTFVPASVVEHLCTCEDPTIYSGRVVDAPAMHAELGLD
jgi:NAD(P)-dependent dehydrogenase (short-subunit alcohol dehydrogenase family)